MKNIYTISFILYLAVLSLFLINTFTYNYVFSDEGTHLLLSVFYKDLIGNLPSTGLSYSNIYDYAINYLVHYPKLQIAYPPMYHFANAAVFSISGSSVFAARLMNLGFAILAFSVFYILVKKHFGEKAALISTIFFSISSYSLLYASRAFQDFAAYFFIILSIWIFTKALETQKLKYFTMLSFTSALAILSKQISAIMILFFLVYVLYRKDLKRERFRNITIFIAVLLILMSPYLILLNKVGGFEINKIVAIGYASQQGEPTSVFDPIFWLYFLIQPSFFAPFTIPFVAVLAFYIYKKEKNWKEFLLFFLVFYISLSAIPNKELRFSQLFLLPAYVTASVFIVKIRNKATLPAILIIYAIISLAIFYPTIQYYPQEEIADRIYSETPKGASIAILSDVEPLYSSSIIYYLAVKDRNMSISVIRPCIFANKTKDDIIKILDESNTFFVINPAWGEGNAINEIKEKLEQAFVTSQNNLTTEVYKYTGFKNKTPEKICNYICLTGEKVCEK